MKRFNQRPDDLALADELHAIDGAVRRAAQTIVPRQSFLDALDAQVQRDATAHIIALPITRTAEAMAAASQRFPRVPSAHHGDTPTPIPDHPAVALQPGRAARSLGRRGFLVGSAVAATSAGFFLVERRQTIVADVAATRQAGRALITAQTVAAAPPGTPATSMATQPSTLDFSAGAIGWGLWGNNPGDYAIGSDPQATPRGTAAAFLRSNVPDPQGFGMLARAFTAAPYRGTRLRMRALVKTDAVENWAGIWMRVDGPDTPTTQRSLSFDNMQNRPIKGTSDWARYEIVLTVPPESVAIAFGILLQGIGEVWLDDVQFATVGSDVPTTGMATQETM
ncbi:MAG: hypothetical protein ACR2JW_08220 [Thermomicrobiales bacterium]